MILLALALFLLLAPLAGGLIGGFDRILTARLQGRIGPPLLQPFCDAVKLWHKEPIVVRRSQNFYIAFYLVFTLFTGALFFTGGDLLLVVFALTLANIFLVLGACKASSPYSFVGSRRELLQMAAYEPMLLLTVVGMYLAGGSFSVADLLHAPLLLPQLPGIFLGFLIILPLKFRKSPFDLAASHHAHQELVRGTFTEFSGRALAYTEVAHWYETTLVLGLAALFFIAMPWLAIAGTAAVYGLVVLIDNATPRLTWPVTLGVCWLAALVLGMGNILWLAVTR